MKLFGKVYFWAIVCAVIYVLFIFNDGHAGKLLLEGAKEQMSAFVDNMFQKLLSSLKEGIMGQ